MNKNYVLTYHHSCHFRIRFYQKTSTNSFSVSKKKKWQMIVYVPVTKQRKKE